LGIEELNLYSNKSFATPDAATTLDNYVEFCRHDMHKRRNLLFIFSNSHAHSRLPRPFHTEVFNFFPPYLITRLLDLAT